MSKEPISIPKTSNLTGRGCGVLFGSVFLMAGLAFAWMTSINPLLKSWSSNSWPETPCTVVKSEIDVDRDSDGTTYRPRIEFTYNFDGMAWQSDTFDFTSLNRSQARCREIVNAHPVGTRMGCFVNPKDPEEAVILREYDFSLFGFIFPLIFVAIGLAVVLGSLFGFLFTKKGNKPISGDAKFALQQSRSSLGQASDGRPVPATEHPGDIEDQIWDKPQKLKPTHSRLAKFALVSGAALFWNGIVGTMIYGFVKDMGQGVDWFFLLFMIPFVLVGLAILCGVIYLLGNLFNPNVELALSTGAVKRGDSVDIAWQLNGRTSGIRNLKVTIEGEESATYQRGTSSITETNVFCTIPVTETTAPEEIEFGSEAVPIPADTMHTFTADKNKILWRIVVHGSIPWWPDVKETFEFRVKP